MSNRVEPEISSITLDQDQVKPSQANKAAQSKTSESSAQTTQTSVSSPSKTNTFFTFVIYLAFAGASWFFYQGTIKLQSVISNSEQQI